MKQVLTSGRGQIAKAFSWMLVDRVTSTGANLLAAIALARYLGPQEFGLLNYVLALAALIAPFSALGLNQILTKDFVTRPDLEGQTLGTAAVLTVSGAVLSTFLVALWLLLFPQGDWRFSTLILVTVAASCIGAFEFLQYWFLAKSLAGRYAFGRVIVTMAFLLIKVTMIALGAGLDSFIIVSALEFVATGVRSWISYGTSPVEHKRWKWDNKLARELLSRSWPMIVGGLTSAAYMKLDLIMLTSLRSAGEAGVYSTAARLSEVWLFLPLIFMSAVFPPLLGIRKTSPDKYLQRLQDLTDAMAAAGMIVAVMISMLSGVLIPLLFGPEYVEAVPILIVHVWSGVFMFMRAVLSKWIIAEGLYIFSLVTQGCGAITNIGLNMILIPQLGGMGAALATLVSYAVAAYFSLLLSQKTRPFFWIMTKALLWPRRLPVLMLKLVRF